MNQLSSPILCNQRNSEETTDHKKSKTKGLRKAEIIYDFPRRRQKHKSWRPKRREQTGKIEHKKEDEVGDTVVESSRWLVVTPLETLAHNYWAMGTSRAVILSKGTTASRILPLHHLRTSRILLRGVSSNDRKRRATNAAATNERLELGFGGQVLGEGLWGMLAPRSRPTVFIVYRVF